MLTKANTRANKMLIQFVHNNKTYPIAVKNRKRSKNITLSVKNVDKITVSKPVYIPLFMVSKLINEKSDWIKTKLDELKSKNEESPFVKLVYKSDKEIARKQITETVNEINSFYNFSYHRIFIKDQKSRWGSCSKNKNLSFSYKIAFMPKHFMEYVVAHELCHLAEFNHSQNFWKLVEQRIPNYKSIRKLLRNSF